MLNAIWLGLVLVSVVYAAFTGTMPAVTKAAFESAESAVSLVIKLSGFMIFMLGAMRVASDAGLLAAFARWLAPILRRLFPEVPPDHPAMGAMVMNMASNMLGLGNAATPFGLKAMVELNRLNPHPGVATNAMVLFLVLAATALHLMAPTGTMAVRAAAGSASPGAIWIPTLIATACSTLAGIAMVFALRGRARYAVRPQQDAPPVAPAAIGADGQETDAPPPAPPASAPRTALAAAIGIALLAAIAWQIASPWRGVPWRGRTSIDAMREIAESWLIPLLVTGLLLVGLCRGVRIYESMVAGAREALDVVVRIVPYLVVIMVAVGMLQGSGVLDLVIARLEPFTSAIGFPAAALPMALLRPLSGTGAFGVMAAILERHGPDSFVGMVASTLQGATDTTFYVLTLYCGSVGVRDMRHAVAACLIGDLAGFAGATAACHLFFG
ncbi:MAG TPA: nucleoside recognition domain-containing protein [Myxococcota bacterium]|nr:nucleoside recognition domain-containing protein [Myxococcota bacterium]